MLVAIFQRGAVDGLSMVPPHGDPGYVRARSSIALAPPRRGDTNAAVDLDGFYALHPSLAPLKPLWDSRTLAVVHACGSPDTTRSHFDAQDYMESGTPDNKGTHDGWLNRYLATRGTCEECSTRSPQPAARSVDDSPFRAIALTPQTPRILE